MFLEWATRILSCGWLPSTWVINPAIYICLSSTSPLPRGATAPIWPRTPLCRGFRIALRHHTRQDSSGRVISPSQRPLPDNTQHSKETDVRVFRGIRTRNPSKRTSADPRLRPRGHWDWHVTRSAHIQKQDLFETTNILPPFRFLYNHVLLCQCF